MRHTESKQYDRLDRGRRYPYLVTVSAPNMSALRVPPLAATLPLFNVNLWHSTLERLGNPVTL